MFGMMIDTGPKFYAIPSPPLYMTSRSRSQTYNFYAKVLRLSFYNVNESLADLIDAWHGDRYWSKVIPSAYQYMTLRSRSHN